MAKAYMCDLCKKLISESDVRIRLFGYTVNHNENKARMPKGYSVSLPEEFCSFRCLANWADEQQKILDDYEQLCKDTEQKKG